MFVWESQRRGSPSRRPPPRHYYRTASAPPVRQHSFSGSSDYSRSRSPSLSAAPGFPGNPNAPHCCRVLQWVPHDYKQRWEIQRDQDEWPSATIRMTPELGRQVFSSERGAWKTNREVRVYRGTLVSKEMTRTLSPSLVPDDAELCILEASPETTSDSANPPSRGAVFPIKEIRHIDFVSFPTSTRTGALSSYITHVGDGTRSEDISTRPGTGSDSQWVPYGWGGPGEEDRRQPRRYLGGGFTSGRERANGVSWDFSQHTSNVLWLTGGRNGPYPPQKTARETRLERVEALRNLQRIQKQQRFNQEFPGDRNAIYVDDCNRSVVSQISSAPSTAPSGYTNLHRSGFQPTVLELEAPRRFLSERDVNALSRDDTRKDADFSSASSYAMPVGPSRSPSPLSPARVLGDVGLVITFKNSYSLYLVTASPHEREELLGMILAAMHLRVDRFSAWAFQHDGAGDVTRDQYGDPIVGDDDDEGEMWRRLISYHFPPNCGVLWIEANGKGRSYVVAPCAFSSAPVKGPGSSVDSGMSLSAFEAQQRSNQLIRFTKRRRGLAKAIPRALRRGSNGLKEVFAVNLAFTRLKDVDYAPHRFILEYSEQSSWFPSEQEEVRQQQQQSGPEPATANGSTSASVDGAAVDAVERTSGAGAAADDGTASVPPAAAATSRASCAAASARGADAASASGSVAGSAPNENASHPPASTPQTARQEAEKPAGTQPSTEATTTKQATKQKSSKGSKSILTPCSLMIETRSRGEKEAWVRWLIARGAVKTYTSTATEPNGAVQYLAGSEDASTASSRAQDDNEAKTESSVDGDGKDESRSTTPLNNGEPVLALPPPPPPPSALTDDAAQQTTSSSAPILPHAEEGQDQRLVNFQWDSPLQNSKSSNNVDGSPSSRISADNTTRPGSPQSVSQSNENSPQADHSPHHSVAAATEPMSIEDKKSEKEASKRSGTQPSDNDDAPASNLSCTRRPSRDEKPEPEQMLAGTNDDGKDKMGASDSSPGVTANKLVEKDDDADSSSNPHEELRNAHSEDNATHQTAKNEDDASKAGIEVGDEENGAVDDDDVPPPLPQPSVVAVARRSEGNPDEDADNNNDGNDAGNSRQQWSDPVTPARQILHRNSPDSQGSEIHETQTQDDSAQIDEEEFVSSPIGSPMYDDESHISMDAAAPFTPEKNLENEGVVDETRSIEDGNNSCLDKPASALYDSALQSTASPRADENSNDAAEESPAESISSEQFDGAKVQEEEEDENATMDEDDESVGEKHLHSLHDADNDEVGIFVEREGQASEKGEDAERSPSTSNAMVMDTTAVPEKDQDESEVDEAPTASLDATPFPPPPLPLKQRGSGPETESGATVDETPARGLSSAFTGVYGDTDPADSTPQEHRYRSSRSGSLSSPGQGEGEASDSPQLNGTDTSAAIENDDADLTENGGVDRDVSNPLDFSGSILDEEEEDDASEGDSIPPPDLNEVEEDSSDTSDIPPPSSALEEEQGNEGDGQGSLEQHPPNPLPSTNPGDFDQYWNWPWATVVPSEPEQEKKDDDVIAVEEPSTSPKDNSEPSRPPRGSNCIGNDEDEKRDYTSSNVPDDDDDDDEGAEHSSDISKGEARCEEEKASEPSRSSDSQPYTLERAGTNFPGIAQHRPPFITKEMLDASNPDLEQEEEQAKDDRVEDESSPSSSSSLSSAEPQEATTTSVASNSSSKVEPTRKMRFPSQQQQRLHRPTGPLYISGADGMSDTFEERQLASRKEIFRKSIQSLLSSTLGTPRETNENDRL